MFTKYRRTQIAEMEPWVWLHLATGDASLQLRESRLDPGENRGLSELGKDPPCLSQMTDSEGILSLAFVKKAKDHFGATDMMAIGVKLRVAPNLGNKCLNRRTPNE